MTEFNQFDFLETPLSGTNLIEASAGTGKTYTITRLFLRLLLEKNLSAEQILVVTFTEAATEELKDRIRSTLREATEAFSGRGSKDQFLNDLVRRHVDPAAASTLLREAIQDFDQAAIFTIHGFCRRMLHENAFESGSPFDAQLLADQEDIKREVVEDFWRKHLYSATPLFANYTIRRVSPDRFFDLLNNRPGQPYLKIIPPVETPDTSTEEREYSEHFERVRLAWQTARAEVEGILTSDGGLNRTRYRTANIPIWIHHMDEYMASGGTDATLFRGFERFTQRELRGTVKKGHTPPKHPFFELCETLKEKHDDLERVFERRLLGLKTALFQYVDGELVKRKGEKNVQFFDDLLLGMHQALEGKGGENLAKAIRMRFRAALIDEFQDTDPIQYAIFKRVFENEDSVLFLIGDPKQAIYGFRGADVFAYVDASKHVKFRYSLGENWRSEPELIAATNTIFANRDRPFVFVDIPFHPATSSIRDDVEQLRIDGRSEPPLQLWFLNACGLTGPGKKISKTQGRELIPKAVAGEISRLLDLGGNNRALVGKRPLREGDIAVLVRRNEEARQMQDALSTLKIPSVLHSTGNLFDSYEAWEMERVLAAIARPNDEKLLRAALVTDMIGLRGEDLVSLMADEHQWESWLAKFKRYHDVWSERGFIRMHRHLMSENTVLPRLMSLSHGERRSTNVRHLAEVLHQRSVERKPGMTGLLKWLSEQRDPGTTRLEEHQLRLESDENAVKLVTIHKSKGLEYPVVFCPFTWGGSRVKGTTDPVMFHDEEDNMRLTLDLGSADIDQNRVRAEKELLAENLRLLYVALTRARNRCYLVWGRFNEAETSAPAYLLHGPAREEGDDVVSAMDQRFEGLGDEEMLREIQSIVEKAEGAIRLSEMETEQEVEYHPLLGKRVELTYRKFAGNIDREWRVSSFSALTFDQPHVADLADRDAIRLPGRYPQEDLADSIGEGKPPDVFSFPRGAKAGTLLHDLLENLDFVGEDTLPIGKLVIEKLNEYGFETSWLETLCDMIDKVLHAQLDPDRKDFTLSCIPNEKRLNELEFYFPLKRVSAKELTRIFREHSGSTLPSEFPDLIEQLRFSPVRGFMKGFVDMVFQFEDRFYLVDWKSNFLGSRVEDYSQEKLAAAMGEEFYILQYHIYTLALDQYLHLRVPGYHYETHFGGIYYIFLRGVNPDKGPEFGIYRDRPSSGLINGLSANLIDFSGSQARSKMDQTEMGGS